MFVYTAKLNKRRGIAILLVAAAALIAIILIASHSGKNSVKTNEDRIKYLTDIGWEVCIEPVEHESIVIPSDMTQVYEDYNALQLAQGFDLTKYAGMEAERYTYEVRNHPDCTDAVYADIIICKNRVIAGDIQSISANGFMQGLEFPK